MVKAWTAHGRSLAVMRGIKRAMKLGASGLRLGQTACAPAHGSAMSYKPQLLADDLATGLDARSVTDARALRDSHSRSKLLPLNPRELNGNRARRGRGARGAAGVSLRRALRW